MEKIKYKILLTTPYFYPQTGGLENYVYNIALGMQKTYGLDVVVVTSGKNKKINVKNINGIKVYRLPVMFKVSNTPINPLWYFNLRKIIKEEKPDIINAHGPVPFMMDMTALAVGSIPFFLTYHSGTMKKNKFLADIAISIYENIFLGFAAGKTNKIIAASNFIKRTILKKYADKVFVINPAVDPNTFKPNNKKRNSDLEKTVLFICRYANMHKMKGLNNLSEAMKLLPDAKLRIIGEKGHISGKNIEYIGIKTGKDLVREIQDSTVVVLPSLAHMESFGMVLVEAMACRVPVIGTNIGGIPEVINDGIDGLIVPPDDSPRLAFAISAILNNPKKSKAMAKNGYKKVISAYTWAQQEEKFFFLLKNSIREKENQNVSKIFDLSQAVGKI